MNAKTYLEPETLVPIYDECDVLVVGGGSAGHSAAVAAARAGCKNVILMERYGYCGGDVTGGYVLLIPSLSFHEKTYVRGIQEEWYTRLSKIPGAVRGPGPELAGITDPCGCNMETGGHIFLSGGTVLISYPVGLVLNGNNEPNIDTRADRVSRNPVEERIPLDYDAAMKIFRDKEDYELDWAVAYLEGK